MNRTEHQLDTSGRSENKAKDDSERQTRLNKLLLDSLPHAAMLIRKDRTILAANKLATEVGALVGGVCWHDFGQCGSLPDKQKESIKNGEKIHSYETHCTFCLADKALSEQKPLNDQEVHAFDRIWDTYWVPLDDEVYLHYAIDVTERICKDRSIKESERRLREFINTTDAGYFFIDTESVFRDVNEAWLAMHGYDSKDEIVGKHFSVTQVDEDIDSATAIVKSLLSGGEVPSGEFSRRCKDGSTGHHSFSVHPVKKDGTTIGLEGFLIDTSERKRTEEALQNRIIALTRPLEDVGHIPFEELFNVDDIQKLQDEFSSATGVASVITKTDGTPITKPSNFCRMCDIIRKTEKGLANCYKSDAALGKPSSDGPTVQTCISGGLWDAGAAIQVGGQHIANWLIGQVRNETQTDDKMRTYAHVIKTDEAELIKAFHEAPSMSLDRFKAVAQSLFTIANKLSQTAYQNIQQARFITERINAEQELVSVERKQRSMLEHISDVIAIIKADGTIAYKSPNIEKVFGWKPEDLIGENAWMTVHPDDLERIQKVFFQLLQEENSTTTVEYRYMCKDESFRWIELTAKNLTSDPDIAGMLLNYHDITERIKHSRETSMLKTAIEQVPVGIALADENLNLYFCNAAGLGLRGDADQLTNIPKEAFANWKVLKLNGEPYATSDLPLVRAVEQGLIVHEEFIVRHDDGSDHICDATAMPVFGEDGETVGGIVMFPDITEKKKAAQHEKDLREQLSRAERLKSLAVLAGGVAHDLNNVLGPMVLLPEMIKEDIEDAIKGKTLANDLVTESLEVMQTSASRAAVVVRDLVALSRRGQYDRIPIDINKLSCFVDNPINMDKTHPEVRVHYDFSNDELIALASSDHLCRVLHNLMHNAIESIHGKGTVTVTTFSKTLKETYVGYNTIPEGSYVVITVSDTGEGITEEHISKIFEPFYTRKSKSNRTGSGLGLSVVHGVMGDHDGFIDVVSEVGQGTTFSLFLPLIENEVIQADGDAEEPIPTGTEHVLIVDDEPAQRFLARKSLQKLGFTISEAENGSEAVALFENAKTAGKPSPFDIVLLDMIMDEGFDGLDTLNEIVKLYPMQKILIVSGHAEYNRSQAAQNLGADWLPKPYMMGDMARAVRKKIDA